MTRCIAIFLWMSATVLHAQTPEWKVQYDSAQRYWGNQWSKTVPFLIKAEKAALYDLGIYDENYIIILNDLGLAYAKTGDYKKAETVLSRAIKIKTEDGIHADADLQRAYLNLAAIHAEQRHFQEAESLYLNILRDASPPEDLLATALKGVVSLYESGEKPAKAISLLKDARFSGIVQAPDWQLTLARLLRADGRHGESMRILTALHKEQLAADQKSGLYLGWLEESALNHLETGNFNAAEKELLDALRLLRSQPTTDDALLTSVLNSLATTYEKLGLREKALAYYQEALPLSQKVYGDRSYNSLTLKSNIAGIYLHSDKITQAIAQYQQVEQQLLAIVPESNAAYLTVLNNLGTAYRANGDAVKARQQFERALMLIDKYTLNETDLAATISNNYAVLLTSFGQFKESTPYYEKAYSIRKKLYGESSVKLADIAGNLAVVYWETGRADEALQLFSESSELAIRQVRYVFPNLSEEEQVQFYRHLKEDFERFNGIAFRAAGRKPELLTQVFNNRLTLKSLRFFTQRHRSDIINQKKDTVLARQFSQLRLKREQLGHLYQRTIHELSREPGAIAQLEREIDALEKSISLETSETVSGKMQNDQVNWADLQRSMSSHEALVEIVRYRTYDLRHLSVEDGTRAMFGFTDSVYYAALITTQETKDHPRVAMLKDGRNLEKRYLSYYRNALHYDVADEVSYKAYWESIGLAIQNKRTVYFSADGVYHQLNLNTLRDPASNTFLADRHEIHYLLNPAQYLTQDHHAFTAKRAILFGDPSFDGNAKTSATTPSRQRYLPLPGTREEVASIDATLRAKGWATQIRLKDQASEVNLKSVQGADILHVATHGFFSADKMRPSGGMNREVTFNSGLLLAGANNSLRDPAAEFQNDGIVTAYEVTNLDLTGTSLVVLSACETGLGSIEIGEGVYGLQRSFLQAGAQNVLISLWKVDDALTRDFMTKFYGYLLTSPDLHDALSKAQSEIRKTNANPVAWGSFLLIGK